MNTPKLHNCRDGEQRGTVRAEYIIDAETLAKLQEIAKFERISLKALCNRMFSDEIFSKIENFDAWGLANAESVV